jgi:hypothetical protein
MKVGEARGIYSTELKNYNMQKFKLAQQKQELQECMDATENGSELYAEQAATLELQYDAVSQKYDEYKNYMDQLMEQWDTKLETVANQQNAEATEDYYKDLSKIMEVARRMSHGDIVPGSDEKKLMEYDKDLYQMAKNAQMMAQLREKKKYKSLWEDEEKKEYDDPMEEADNQEAFAEGPEVADVAGTMESASSQAESE